MSRPRHRHGPDVVARRLRTSSSPWHALRRRRPQYLPARTPFLPAGAFEDSEEAATGTGAAEVAYGLSHQSVLVSSPAQLSRCLPGSLGKIGARAPCTGRPVGEAPEA